MMMRQRLKYWLHGYCPGFAGSFRYFGTRVYFSKGSRAFAAACQQGIFESMNVRALLTMAKPDTTVFDIGANLGLMAIPVLSAHDTVRVVSFEPSETVLPHLQRTHRESRYRERWTIVPKALGANPDSVMFNLAAPELDGLYDGVRATPRVGRTRQIRVEMTTLDAVWRALGSPTVSVIKCDVEGGELEVLRGASQCIAAFRPPIVIEWNRQNLSAYNCPPESLLTFTKQHCYSLHALPHLTPIEDEYHLELQMGSCENFVLLPRSMY